MQVSKLQEVLCERLTQSLGDGSCFCGHVKAAPRLNVGNTNISEGHCRQNRQVTAALLPLQVCWTPKCWAEVKTAEHRYTCDRDFQPFSFEKMEFLEQVIEQAAETTDKIIGSRSSRSFQTNMNIVILPRFDDKMVTCFQRVYGVMPQIV